MENVVVVCTAEHDGGATAPQDPNKPLRKDEDVMVILWMCVSDDSIKSCKIGKKCETAGSPIRLGFYFFHCCIKFIYSKAASHA